MSFDYLKEEFEVLSGATSQSPQAAGYVEVANALSGVGETFAAFLREKSGSAVKFQKKLIPEGPNKLRMEFTQYMRQGDRVSPRFFLSVACHPDMGYVVESGYKDGWGRILNQKRLTEISSSDLLAPDKMFAWMEAHHKAKAPKLTSEDIESIATGILNEDFGTVPSDEERARVRLTESASMPEWVNPDMVRLMGTLGD
jgi:hypothetical protein